MKKYRFPCGCEFDTNENGGIIINEHQFNPNCPATYQLIAEGRTVGCFQIESQLLIQWCKKLKPKKLSEVSDLVAIVRPGTLKSVVKTIKDGDKIKNITAAEWYIKVKMGEEPEVYFDPSLEPILKSSYTIMLYQEQMLQIARLIGGFSEIEADLLRRGIGKKDATIVTECKKLFVEKAEGVGILSKEKAEELFHQIEAANRYSFNKSHSYCYGVTAYESAYYKQHFPLEFYVASLKLSMEEQDPLAEIRRVVGDARKHKFVVSGPDINDLEPNFYIRDDEILFGLANINGLGDSSVEKLKNNVKRIEQAISKPIQDWSWFDFLVNLTVSKEGSVFGSSNLAKLIQAGAIDRGIPRKRMLFELQNWDELTKGEKEWVYTKQFKFSNIREALEALGKPKKQFGGCHNAERVKSVQSIIKILNNPPSNLDDTILSISKMEGEMLGLALSCSKVDACETMAANCTVEEFEYKRLQWYVFGVECKQVNTITCKNGASKGREMSFLTIEDQSGTMDDVVVFCDEWEQYGHLLQPGNTVLIEGQKDRNKGSFIVKRVEQI